MKEICKPILGYKNLYSVNQFGNVRRDKSGCGICIKGRILKPVIKSGYPCIRIYKNGIQKFYSIASIVAKMFIGKRPKNYEINHIDGVKTNNHVSNLEYVTASENVRHAVRNGLRKPRLGIENNYAKLTEKQVLKIRELWNTKKYFQYEIGKMFNVHQGTIHHITSRKQWKHI